MMRTTLTLTNRQNRLCRELSFAEMKKLMNQLNEESLLVLTTILNKQPATLKELAFLTGKQPSNLSRTLKNLSAAGLIDQSDKSSVGRLLFQQLEFQLSLDVPATPTVVSLFSGCGGLDLGFQMAGYKIVFANDIEPSVKETYETNLGHPILIQDIKTVDKHNDIPVDVDIVLAGIPCQPFSNAGKRGAMNDDRGRLFEQVMEVVDIKKPKIVLFENVRGFLSAKDDRGVLMTERIREELSSHGYSLSFQLLNAADYEVPQNRYRVVMVGVRNDIKELRGDFLFPSPVPRTELLTVGAVIKDSVLPNEPQEIWALSPQTLMLAKHIPAGGSWKSIPDEYLPPRLKRIKADMKHYHSPNFYRKFNVNEIMGTITAAATPENSGILHPYELRRYSVREIARFQSFPDEFKFLGCTTSKKYKMIGNAVPPKLGFHIGKALLKQYFQYY